MLMCHMLFRVALVFHEGKWVLAFMISVFVPLLLIGRQSWQSLAFFGPGSQHKAEFFFLMLVKNSTENSEAMTQKRSALRKTNFDRNAVLAV